MTEVETGENNKERKEERERQERMGVGGWLVSHQTGLS